MTRWLSAVPLVLAIACGGGSSGTPDVLPDPGPRDVLSDDAVPPPEDPGVPDGNSDVPAELAQDPGNGDTGPVEDAVGEEGPDAVVPPIPFGPANRGFVEHRAIVHLHSQWSHDGCFPDHEGIDPSLFRACEDEHRLAPCRNGISLVFQTDHPGDVRDASFEEALHYRPEEGDTLVLDSQGRTVANRVRCPEGSLIPSFLYFVGCEGNKNMPVGLSAPVPPEVFSTSYHDAVPLEQVQAAIAQVHAQGGYAFVNHPEEAAISVERLVQASVDGIEIFNVHPMLMDALMSGLDRFLLVDRFMEPGRQVPDPDLALLLLLQPVAEDPRKFDAVAPRVRMTVFGATDIHRNVEIPSLCSDLESCEPFTSDFPHMARTLVSGGPVPLSDGDRFDSFGRSFRWFANRVLLPADRADDPDEARNAVGQGRLYVAFDLVGSPEGFDFFGIREGRPVEMGQEVQADPGVALYLRVPTLVAPPWGIAGVDPDAYASARVTTRVIRATDEGSSVVATIEGQGRTWTLPDAPAGAWRVEVDVVPLHLAGSLDMPGLEGLASASYPYLYSNAIFLR